MNWVGLQIENYDTHDSVALNENTLTWESGSYGYKVISESGTISGSAINMFYITKIIGYKY